MLKSRIKIKITGKNIDRFIKRLNHNNIELLNISNLKHDYVELIIYKKDYLKVLDLKSIYEIEQLNIYGMIKIKKIINIYKYLISSILLGILLIVFLSNIIFDVEIIHNDSSTRNFILKELESYNIKKYKFVKKYDEIQNIKKDILEKYKDKIEWIEITRSGTKYIVKLELRILPNINNDDALRNVVSSKSAVLKKVIAKKGTIVKDIDTFINKGDVVISGDIYLNEELKESIHADGTIYGEVWYNVTVEYPFVYIENKETGNNKNVFVLKLFNKNIEFSKNHFKEKKYEEKVILKNDLIPISFTIQKQKEIINIEEILNSDEAISKAIQKAKDKISESLNSDEYIIDYKVLNSNIENDKVIVNVFFTVFENITNYELIEG